MLEYSGWIGSFLFALCGLPQAIQSYTDKHSDGLNWLFIIAWFFGEIFTLVYIIPKGDIPLIVNYSVNLVFVLVIAYYKLYPRK
jgi:uncharacterized protein with PQ loop repeat